MNPRKGRLLAWGSTVGAVLVLVTGVVALRGRIAEEYWLWKLESGNPEVQRVAVEKLGKMRSLRAVPALMRGYEKSTPKLTVHAWVHASSIRFIPVPDNRWAKALGAISIEYEEKAGALLLPFLVKHTEHISVNWEVVQAREDAIVIPLMATLGVGHRQKLTVLYHDGEDYPGRSTSLGEMRVSGVEEGAVVCGIERDIVERVESARKTGGLSVVYPARWQFQTYSIPLTAWSYEWDDRGTMRPMGATFGYDGPESMARGRSLRRFR
jgi:hypothetical protein